MYKCLNCGHIFDEGEQHDWKESRGEFWGSPCSEKMSGCPICKGDYEEVKPCKICGSYEHNADETYCDECKKDVKNRFTKFIDKEFTKEERKLLNELYDGENI